MGWTDRLMGCNTMWPPRGAFVFIAVSLTEASAGPDCEFKTALSLYGLLPTDLADAQCNF